MTRDDYVASIKSAFITVGSKAVEGILIGYFPFLASPFLAPVMNWMVEKVMTDLADGGELAAFFIYMDFRVTAQGRAFSDAAAKNQEALKNGTDAEKAQAKIALMQAFADFARLST